MEIPLGHEFIRNTEWRKRTSQIRSRVDSVTRLFRSKKYSAPDDFFFSFEDLSLIGKEYWFLYFNVPGTRQQAVMTFGRSEEEVGVNRARVPRTVDHPHPRPGNAIKCAAVCWLYGGKKQVVIDSQADVSLQASGKRNLLCAKNGRGDSASIEGKYPDFRISLLHNGKSVFSARASPQKEGLPYEIIQTPRAPIAKALGAVIVNYYFDFAGVLDGKKVHGKAYLQKVVATIPFVPWNWVRVQFSHGATFDFFAAKLHDNAPAELQFASNNSLDVGGRRIRAAGRLKIESWFKGEQRKWLLSGKDFYLAMETYSAQPFIMTQKTVFRYDEYLVRVTDFAMKSGGRIYSLSDLGEGSGIVEDANGYLI